MILDDRRRIGMIFNVISWMINGDLSWFGGFLSHGLPPVLIQVTDDNFSIETYGFGDPPFSETPIKIGKKLGLGGQKIGSLR